MIPKCIAQLDVVAIRDGFSALTQRANESVGFFDEGLNDID